MNANLKTIGAAVVLLLSAGAVSAQSAYVKLPSVAVPPNVRADELRREAMKFYEQVSTLRRAASLHEREAALRVEADPLRIEALDLAARLYSYSGDHDRGTMLMEKAARSALLRGDVVRAAHSYLDAAFMALKLKNGERAATLIHEADLLALSPLLSVADKDAIVRRINPARETLGLRGPVSQTGLTARDLRWIADAYDQAQRVRLQAGERIRAIAQGRDPRMGGEVTPDSDELLRLIRHGDSDGPVPLLARTYRRHWEEEQELRVAMEQALASHPAWPWLESVRGIGPTLSARLLARLDVRRAPTPSSFWAYCGLATVPAQLHRCELCGATPSSARGRKASASHNQPNGKPCTGKLHMVAAPEGMRVAQPMPSRGESSVYDRQAKKICYLIGVSFLRSRSEYREYYDRERERLVNERPDWNKARQHLASLRKMEKLFLSHLWAEWAKAEGIPLVRPYAYERALAMLPHPKP